jgi:hypothetical protein
MSCSSSYGFTIPSTTKPDPRPIFTTKPDPFLSFPRTSHPIGSSLKVKATVKDRFEEEEQVKLLEPVSFYELLGIPKSGSLPEIKHAYKQLALKYHPDVSPPGRVEEYTQRFIQVQEAYEILSDPRSKAMYDRDMAKGLQLAFSSGRRYNQYQYHPDMDGRGEWKARWQSQLSELKRRNMYKDTSENMSWAARMRRQQEEEGS